MKIDKTSWVVWLEGHSVFLPCGLDMSVCGKIMQPVVLSVLQGKGLARKEASLLT